MSLTFTVRVMKNMKFLTLIGVKKCSQNKNKDVFFTTNSINV